MRRLCWLVLAMVVAFLGAAGLDPCVDCGSDVGCPPACHLTCADGCAVAPLALAPARLNAIVASSRRVLERPAPRLDRAAAPELPPPRG